MNETEKQAYFAAYNDRTHTCGRIWSSCILAALLAAPFLMGAVLGAMPSFGALGKGLAQIALVYIPSCIVEFLLYTPMLGAGASYLGFLTGNLLNLKIPCAVNARDMVGAKAGTPENEIVSTLAVATSALVTTAVIALGVLCLIPLQPILSSPVLQPAFENVVPTLFGAMAYKYFRGNLRIAALPVLSMSLLCIFVPGAISNVGFLLVPSGAIAIGAAYFFFKKEAA